MAPALTVTPNPAPTSSVVSIAGTGFSNLKTRLMLDGAGTSTNIFRPRKDGTFHVGITVSSTAKTQTLVAQQQSSTTWYEKARTSIVVQAVVDPNPPPDPPPVVNSVTVNTIPLLLSKLLDDTLDEIVVTNGIYSVSPASQQTTKSLWIGSAYASRTRPITVRAQTSGGVTFDGGGANGGGLSFNGGSHDQTWDGFKFAGFRPEQTGVIVFGGYGLAPSHHITISHLTMLSSIVGVSDHNDHLIYFSSDGWHDILIEDYTATPGLLIQSALQFNHDPNGYNVTVRRMHVTGTQTTILLFAATLHDVLIVDSDITNARDNALNVYQCGANVVLNNVTSVNSHGVGYSPGGNYAGLSFVNCNLA